MDSFDPKDERLKVLEAQVLSLCNLVEAVATSNHPDVVHGARFADEEGIRFAFRECPAPECAVIREALEAIRGSAGPANG